jgi:hypothetical protein
MLRAENPFNQKLRPCVTFAVVRGARENGIDVNHQLFTEFETQGGTLHAFGEKDILITVNHSRLDGIGSLYFLDQVMDSRENIVEALPFDGNLDGFKYRQICSFNENKASTEQTFTQRFVARLLENQSHLKTENIGLVVNVLDSVPLFCYSDF